MKFSKYIYAARASFLAMFVLSTIWYLFLMADFFAQHRPAIARAAALIQYIVLGYLILAALMTFVYQMTNKTGRPAAHGFKVGALLGLIYFFPLSFGLYAIWQISAPAFLVDSLWHLFEQGVGGVVFAQIYK